MRVIIGRVANTMQTGGAAGAEAPRNTTQVVGVQYLRGIAALVVVVHHVLVELYLAGIGSIPQFVVVAGSVGVDTFFVISGFIMVTSTFPTAGAPLTPQRFLFNRAKRIYPLYWVFATTVILLMSLGVHAKEAHSLASVVRSFFLLPTPISIISYAWTLIYEVYFYLVFALFLFSRRPRTTAIGVAGLLLFLFVDAGASPDPAVRDFLSDPIAFEFCFGLSLGLLYRARPRWFAPSPWLWAAVVAASLVILIAPLYVGIIDTFGPAKNSRIFVWGLPAAIFVALAIGLRPLEGPLGRFALLLGNASYALYLAHFFVANPYGRALTHIPAFAALPQILIAPLVGSLCVAAGIGTHLLVEKPLGRLVAGKRPLPPGIAVRPLQPARDRCVSADRPEPSHQSRGAAR